MRKLWLLAASLSLLLVAKAPTAFAEDLSVVATCGTLSLPTGYAVAPASMDQTGQTCVSSSGGGGGAVTTSPAVVTPTDKSGTITTGGTAQTAIAANASRKQWCIQNAPTETENMNVRSGTAATTTTGVMLVPGAQACNQPGVIDQGIISVVAATTGHRWFGTEEQ